MLLLLHELIWTKGHRQFQREWKSFAGVHTFAGADLPFYAVFRKQEQGI